MNLSPGWVATTCPITDDAEDDCNDDQDDEDDKKNDEPQFLVESFIGVIKRRLVGIGPDDDR